jgi:predicted HicB family RNase H-like nuclease
MYKGNDMNLEKKRELKRLILDIHEDAHQEIKSKALERKLTIKQYVMQAIQERMTKEEK